MSKWYAIYTRPRWEKKVYDRLQKQGIGCYCPLNKIRRQWSDRIKIVEEPLFKSYVFVQATDEDRTAVRMVEGVINFVYWNGKPAIVKDKEIEMIKRFLNEHENVSLLEANLKPDSKVLVTGGALMDQTGKVLQMGNKTVKVLIQSLGYYLVAQIPVHNVTLLPTHNPS